jgi:hypothetical protein
MEQLEQGLNTLIEVMRTLQTMNAPTGGAGAHMQPFDESNETFQNFLQRLESYFELKGVTGETPEINAKKVNHLITLLSPTHFTLLASLTAPDPPKSKTFEELSTLLKNHMNPVPSEIAEQHKFSMRMQNEGESISKYVAELKGMTTNCNFKCNGCQQPTNNTHLRTQFIRGVRDGEIREKLLQEKSSEFSKIVEIAQSIEMSKQESQQMQCAMTVPPSSLPPINKVGPNRQFTKSQPNHDLRGRCYRCGDSEHRADACRFKSSRCNKCKATGHLAKVCQGRRLANPVQQHQVEEDDETDDEEPIQNVPFLVASLEFCEHSATVSAVEPNEKMYAPPRLMMPMRINGRLCQMEHDTGAAMASMSVKT